MRAGRARVYFEALYQASAIHSTWRGGLNFIFIFTWSTSFPRVFAFLLVPIFVLCERFFSGFGRSLRFSALCPPTFIFFFSIVYVFSSGFDLLI